MIFAGSACAGAKEYYCTVKQEVKLSEDGKVLEEKASPFVGKDFRISRETGVVTSAVRFASFEKIRVLFPGSAEHSFVGLAEEIGPFPMVSLLEVHEFVSGVVQPFLWHIRGSVLYSGTCL
jgi:hypothetical protein